MESHLRSRKRKHHQSKESDVMFTRSKSQIYVHRHRSGHARPDRSGGLVESVGSEGKVVPKEVKLDGRMDRVKDLRARRVFSPATISTNDDEFDVCNKKSGDDVINGADDVINGCEAVEINVNGGDVINGGEDGDGDVSKEGEEVDGDVNVNGGDDVINGAGIGSADVIKEGGEVVEIGVNKDDDVVMKGGENGADDVINGGEVGGDVNLNSGDVINGVKVVSGDVIKEGVEVDGDVNVNGGDDVIKGGEIGDADVIKGDGEVNNNNNSDVVSVAAKEVCGMNKSQSTVTSLRGRRKVFKSPSSFSYRRLLPYLQEIDSSNFEIVDAKLPEKNLKLGDNASNMVAHGDQEISAVSAGNLTDETSKSVSEEQYSNKVNPEVSRNVESSDMVQKIHDDVLNDTFEECEQMAPPDNEFDDVCKKSGDDVINGGEVVSGDVIKGDEVDVCKKIDVDGGDVNVNDDGVIKGDEISKDDEVVIGDVINEGEFGGDDVIKVCEVVESDKNEGDAVKSQSSVTSLRGRRKVFKSPSSFSYRRLLSYLQDTDSSNFEIVDAKLPEKNLKLGDNAPNMVAHREQEISAVSVGINLTDESSKIASEEQYLNKVNPEVSRNVESSDVVQKSHDDVLNDTLEECEQMTPPDADIYSKPKTDKMLDVVVKPKPKPVLTPCSRMNLLQTPTSYTHRRLLPFLMSVAEDGTLKGNQSSKVTKGREQSQQPPTLSLSHKNLGMDEPKIISNPEQQDATNEKSDSPTSTLIPADTSLDRKRIVTLVSSDNLLDTHGSDMECSGSATQLEVNSQSEAVEFDNSIKMELSPLKDNLKRVEEATFKAIETVPSICTEQITDADNDFTGIMSSCSEDNQELVNESAHQTLQITPLMTPSINGENFRNGILKRTPRGCRGICNCLNCTSFRLHAERSFEFSRNQMHDAEEVALDLINDLTSLRKLLETTASDSNSLATDKEKQIKEACEKALYKEEVAKARLSQMNEDLSFHCRSMKLLRPKVTFANKIEEKLISKDVCGKKSV